MKIIDAHLHFTARPGFEETAREAGHINSAAHLGEVFSSESILAGIAMGAGCSIAVPDGVSAPMVPDLAAPFEIEHYTQPRSIFYCAGVDSATFSKENAARSLPWFEKLLKTPACVGLKLYPGYHPISITDPLYFPLYELAGSYNVPVVFHSGDTAGGRGLLKYAHPLLIDEVAAAFPLTRFVIAHYGNPWIVDATQVAIKNANVYIDLSGLATGNFLASWFISHYNGYVEHLKTWMVYLSDYGKFLYGSDWPLVYIPEYIKLIKFMVPEEYHEDVFYHNALRVFTKMSYNFK